MRRELLEAIEYALSNFKARNLDERGRQLMVAYLSDV